MFKSVEILAALPIKEVWADSDGYRRITIYVSEYNGLDKMFKSIVLKIASKMPLDIMVFYMNAWAKVVWMDQEYISLDYYPNGFYAVVKRAELGLL
jgi:hypothetical protein